MIKTLSLRLLLVIMMAISSCSPALISKKSDERILYFKFDYLESRAKFKYNNGKEKLSANASFRIKRGEKIWVSISPGLGIEFARVLIDQHQIQMIDKMKKNYYQYDYSSLTKKYGLDISYDLIETAIIGNVLFEPIRKEVQKDPEYLQYARQKGPYVITHYIAKRNAKLKRLIVQDQATSNTISVNYTGFEQVGEQTFPQKIRVKVQDNKINANNIHIDIDYNKTSIPSDSLSFPFKVTSRYERKTP